VISNELPAASSLPRRKSVVLKGFRRDTPIRDLCRREGIHPSTYYAWLKDFTKTGKETLTRGMVRDATKAEVQELKRENNRLKQLVAELSLQVHVLKKRQHPAGMKARYARMSAVEKSKILSLIASSGIPRRTALRELGPPRNTFYRWLKRE